MCDWDYASHFEEVGMGVGAGRGVGEGAKCFLTVACLSCFFCIQGLTNPLSGCLGQEKFFAGQVKHFLTCREKFIRYIGKPKEIQYFVAEVLYQTS